MVIGVTAVTFSGTFRFARSAVLFFIVDSNRFGVDRTPGRLHGAGVLFTSSLLGLLVAELLSVSAANEEPQIVGLAHAFCLGESVQHVGFLNGRTQRDVSASVHHRVP